MTLCCFPYTCPLGGTDGVPDEAAERAREVVGLLAEEQQETPWGKNASSRFLSAFPTSAPSLSWQNDGIFSIKWHRKRDAFFAPLSNLATDPGASSGC